MPGIQHSGHRIQGVFLALLLGVAVSGCAPSVSDMPRERHDAAAEALERTAANKQLVIDMWHTIFTEKRVREGFERYISANYIQHNPLADDGPHSAMEFLSTWFETHPQAIVEVKRVIAEGDLVVIHHHMRTSPEDRGSAAVDIFRVENGQVVEHWDVVQRMPETSANPHPMF
ncbi:MAG: polyketide cyclase [Proteobacteria bacterium]|nr:MAG: polyketide cyclase [Pseudomonadota bacterium]